MKKETRQFNIELDCHKRGAGQCMTKGCTFGKPVRVLFSRSPLTREYAEKILKSWREYSPEIVPFKKGPEQ